MMTKKYVFTETAKRIEDRFKTEGFKFVKSNGRILNKYASGFDVIILKVLDYTFDFQIETFLGLRINKVEEVVNKFMPNRNPKFMKFTETIGASYMVLSGAKENHIEIETEKELDNAINELTELIENKGLAFFERHRNLEVVNAIKKEQILKSKHNVITNIMQSLTLMKLCNDPDFDELCGKYKEIYVPFVGEEETGIKSINDLIAYLKAM